MTWSLNKPEQVPQAPRRALALGERPRGQVSTVPPPGDGAPRPRARVPGDKGAGVGAGVQ